MTDSTPPPPTVPREPTAAEEAAFNNEFQNAVFHGYRHIPSPPWLPRDGWPAADLRLARLEPTDGTYRDYSAMRGRLLSHRKQGADAGALVARERARAAAAGVPAHPTLERAAAVVADLDPDAYEMRFAEPRPGDVFGQVLLLPADGPSNVAGHRLAVAAVTTFNQLTMDAAALLRHGDGEGEGAIGDELAARNARLPAEARLPGAVLDELIGRVRAASRQSLDRTLTAFHFPEAEAKVREQEIQRLVLRERALRYGLDGDGSYAIHSEAAEDWEDGDDAAEADYLIGGMLLRGQYGTLFAPPKAGKTLLCASMAVYGALGRPVWSYEPFDVARPFKTLLMSKESDAGLLKALLRSVARSLDVNPRQLGRMIHTTTRHPVLNHPATLRHLTHRIRDEGIDLLVVDPLAAAVELPPNVTSDMNALYAGLRPLVDAVQEAGGTLLFTHHVTKPAAKKGRIQLSDAAGAGHEAWVRHWGVLYRRLAYDVTRPGHHELRLATGISGGLGTAVDLVIAEYDGEGNRRWSVTAAPPAPAAPKSERTEKPPGLVKTARRVVEKPDESDRRRDKILQVLRATEKPIAASTLSNHVKIFRGVVEKELATLVAQGSVEQDGTTPQGNPLYRITDPAREREPQPQG